MHEPLFLSVARLSDCALLSAHPHLRRIEVDTPSGPAAMPAPAPIIDSERRYGGVPALGEHGDSIRKEFLGNSNEGKRS
jgi:crotonobetainyl-CoA:carnitine CoA-transferase CaiB-like acyl-CoA transferase